MKAEHVSNIRTLGLDELYAVSGGRDMEREKAVIEAYKVLESIELTMMDVEPVPYVPMKL
jgi:hypothetical protein